MALYNFTFISDANLLRENPHRQSRGNRRSVDHVVTLSKGGT